MRTSGRSSLTALRAWSPEVITSSILICDCALRSDRMCIATCGTSSTTSRRICSANPHLVRRRRRGFVGHDKDSALAHPCERLPTVRAVAQLDHHPRLPDECGERLRRWIPELVTRRKPRYRTIGLYCIRDRGERDAKSFRRLSPHQFTPPDDLPSAQ